mgnify:FL=1
MGLFDSKEKKLFDEKLKQIFSVGEEFKIDICNICGTAVSINCHLLHLKFFHKEDYEKLLPYYEVLDKKTEQKSRSTSKKDKESGFGVGVGIGYR